MKRSTGKIVASLIACGGLLLAGCGSDDSGGGAATTSSATEASTTAADVSSTTAAGSSVTAVDASSSTTTGGDDEPVSDAELEAKVGALVTLSGPAAFVGIAHQNSLKVAEDIINADPVKYLGGPNRSISFDVRDAGADVPPATTLARTFAGDDDYLALLGPSTSPQALSVGPFAQQSGIPLVIPFSPAPGLTDPGKYVFKLATSNDTLARLLIPQVLADHEITKAGVIYNTDNQANLLAGEAALQTFKDEGIETVEATLPFTSNDYSQVITKLQSEGVQAVFIATNSGGVVSAITEADRNGFDPLWMGGPLVGEHSVEEAVGSLVADRLIFASDYNSNLDTPLATEFREKYRAETGVEADQYAADGFTSALVIAAAVKSIAADEISRDELTDALAGLEDVETPLGDGWLSFDEARGATLVPALFKFGASGAVEPLV